MIPLRGALRRSGFFVAAAALAIGAAVALAPKQPMASASSSGWMETWAAAPMKPTREVINRATAGEQANYLAAGNHVSDTREAAFRGRSTSWYFLDGVEVLGACKRAGVVVAYGDSITDGVGSAYDVNDRWPDFLARRLDSAYGNQAPAVIDEGIGGNRVLNPSACFGPSAVARFSRDVLDQPGVRAVIVLEGINDIGYSEDANLGCEAPNTNVSATSSTSHEN